MSHHEYNRIRLSLAPFIRLMLAIAMLGLLASCGGGGATGSTIDSSGNIPFDNTKINYSSNSPEMSIGTIENQFIVSSNGVTNEILAKNLQPINGIKILRVKEYVGVFIEASDDFDINIIKSRADVSDVSNRVLIGEKINSTFYQPSDGFTWGNNNSSWHLNAVNLPLAWDISRGNENQKIGIIDTDTRSNHSELTGKISNEISYQSGLIVKLIYPGHGTSVAGTIIGNTNNDVGISAVNHFGKAVLAGTDCASKDDGKFYEDMVRSGVKVINNSYGCMGPLSNEVLANKSTRLYRNIAIKTPDILHIWAAGNHGNDASIGNGALHQKNYPFPATDKLKNVLVVAAFDSDFELVSSSNYGELIDIAAPAGYKAPTTQSITGDDNYSNDFNGTSAATPIVTGIASLISSINDKLTAEEIKNIIIDSAINGGKFITKRKTGDGNELLNIRIPQIDAKLALDMAFATLSKPTANITILTPNPTAGNEVIFKVQMTSANGGIVETQWDYGDGMVTPVMAGTVIEVRHTYTTAGTYTAKLKIKDAKGVTNTIEKIVVVAPVASANLLLGATVSDSCFNCTIAYNGDPNNITDGNMESGRNLAMHSGTFHIFLTNPKSIGRLKLLPAMTPNGLVYYEIQTSTDPTGAVGTWTSHGGEKSSEWANNTWVDLTLNTNTQNVRVIKVNVTYTPSWLAFFEIEGYAQ